MHTFVKTTHSVPAESSTAQRTSLYYSDKCMPLRYDKLAVNLQIAFQQKTDLFLTVICKFAAIVTALNLVSS